MNTPIIEITAAVCGLLGTLLLATNGRWAGWGFVAFLGSNAGWLAFSFHHAHWFMFWQQVGFTVSSLVGVWVWLVKPATLTRAKTDPKSSQGDFYESGSTSGGVSPQNAPDGLFLGCRHYVPDGSSYNDKLVRSYILRRWFNARPHAALVQDPQPKVAQSAEQGHSCDCTRPFAHDECTEQPGCKILKKLQSGQPAVHRVVKEQS